MKNRRVWIQWEDPSGSLQPLMKLSADLSAQLARQE